MSESPVSLNGRREFLAAACQLMLDCHHSACLLSQGLDPHVFGEPSFAEAVKQFLLSHDQTRLRVLVVQPQRATQVPHALVELGRRLSSRVEFREFSREQAAHTAEMLITDGRLLLERASDEALEARLIRNDASTARERQSQFDHFWEYALPSPELRQLSL